MIRRTMIVASMLALAAGCHAHKETSKARAEATQKEKKAEDTAQNERDRTAKNAEDIAANTEDTVTETRDAAIAEANRLPENVENAPENAVAEAKRVPENAEKAANSTVAEAKRIPANAEKAAGNTADATKKGVNDTLNETDRAEEKVLGENETIPPERPEGDTDTGDVTAQKPAVAMGTEVVASVGNIDRTKKKIVFRVMENNNSDEKTLQSGKEITVPFMDLKLLTGMEADKAITALQEAGNVKIRVLGAGNTMRVIDIDMDAKDDAVLPDLDETKDDATDKY